LDARAGVSSTTISNKVQLSPETFEREREGKVEYGREQNVEDTEKGIRGRGTGAGPVERKRNRER